jgi:hypothetical protein
MRNRVLPALLLSAAALTAAASAQVPSGLLTVHEWGTFTSIADADGTAVQWLPLAQQTDLPCFVERSPGNPAIKLATAGTVRMETPVVYFYSPRAVEASVHVSFPQGLITEWYPHATVPQPRSNVAGEITWPIVAVQPGAKTTFPIENAPSHYYAARETDSDPIRVGAKPERFLFYRGVGQFQPPLAAIAAQDGSVAIKSIRGQSVGDVLFFESRRGTTTFSAQNFPSSSAVLSRPALDEGSGPPLAELKRVLKANGLYEREAQAMLDTWKDSWFEEGARLLYIVPRADVDRILPLTISPTPSTVTRVFVGRIELMTPATLQDVRAAITSGDRGTMLKYGRFLQPIADRLALSSRLPPTLYATPSSCR